MNRRILTIVSIAALALTIAPSAHAATRSAKVEGTNWFWQSQRRAVPSDIHQQECPPGQTCPDPQLQLRNPHQEGALPVEVRRGEDEKISAIAFDLGFIPTQGATISKFKFSIVESQDAPDRAQSVAEGQKIQACRITETWATSEDGADLWADKPKFDCGGAAIGKTKASGGVTRWHFDITKIAATWGSDPTSAYGVMLVGVKPKDSSDTWQMVLKGPRRNDANTPANEAKANAKNIQANITYTPNPAPSVSGGGFFDSSGSGFGFSSSETTTPTTGTEVGSAFPVTPTPAPIAPGVPAPASTPASAQGNETKGPELPPVFWLMIPVALLALSMVRNILLAPLPGKRPDGVVALIRNHNAARFARPPRPDARSPFASITGPLRRAGEAIRGLTRRVVSGGAG